MTETSPPRFAAGSNLAMKVPAPLYDQTVAFYRDTLALPLLKDLPDGTIFAFGAMKLYIDRCPQMSQAEIWLQVTSSDTAAAAEHLATAGVARCDAIEPLPAGFDGFWISSTAGIIHLIDGAPAPSA